jgi:hypothetical protein
MPRGRPKKIEEVPVIDMPDVPMPDKVPSIPEINTALQEVIEPPVISLSNYKFIIRRTPQQYSQSRRCEVEDMQLYGELRRTGIASKKILKITLVRDFTIVNGYQETIITVEYRE